MNSEQRMWRGINSHSKSFKIGQPEDCQISPSTDKGVFIYSIDTRFGLLCPSSMNNAEFVHYKTYYGRFLAGGEITSERLVEKANSLIAEVAQDPPSTDEPAEMLSIATSYALVLSPAFAEVSARQDYLDGHWLYLVYHTRFKGLVGSSFYLPALTEAFLTPEKLLHAIQEKVRFDTKAPESSLKSIFKEAGGVILGPIFG